jgi:hypothetical protein
MSTARTGETKSALQKEAEKAAATTPAPGTEGQGMPGGPGGLPSEAPGGLPPGTAPQGAPSPAAPSPGAPVAPEGQSPPPATPPQGGGGG